MTRRFARKLQTLRFVAVFIATFAVLALFAASSTAQNPVPLTNQPLVPDATAPGGPQFTLTVNGTGFVSGSVVNWNGSPRATTFVNGSQLTATILASDVASASTAAVTVVSPTPGGGTSNTVFFPINTPSTSIAFSTTDYSVGQDPNYASAADFNQDGKQDLVVANSDSASVSVMLGNGDGTFRNPVSYAVGPLPQAPIVGDFNGDGKLDLAVTYQLKPSAVAILLGNGDGTFQSPVSYPVGNGAAYGLAADFAGNGKLDLLIVNQDDGTLSLLLGNGDGTFQQQVVYGAGGAGATGAAVGDFNGDGVLDIAVSSLGFGSFSILLGNGDGTFQPAVGYYGAGAGPSGLAVADVNGDGILDVLLANQGSSNIAVLLGNGDGTFGNPVNYAVAAGAVSAEVGDFNQDGKIDIAVATNGPTLDVLLGNGDGTFQAASSFPTAANPWNVMVADFNGEGRLDAAVPGADINAIAVMLQTAPGQTAATITTLASSPNLTTQGQAVGLTAGVSSTAGTPAGTVIFYDSSTAIGSAKLVSGSATISASALAAGTHSITAAYQGSSKFGGSVSGPVNPVVTSATFKVPTTTTMPENFTAVVSSTSGPPPNGEMITFKSGQTVVATVPLSGGSASLTPAPSGAVIRAYYGGDSNFAASASAPAENLISRSNPGNPCGSSTMLSAGQDSFPIPPNLWNFTAQVNMNDYCRGNRIGYCVGTVAFTDGSTALGTLEVGNSCSVTLSSVVPIGGHLIKATFSPLSPWQKSAAAITQVVTGYPTSASLVSAPSSSTYGEEITLAATIGSALGADGFIPTGKVTFVGAASTPKIETLNDNGVAVLTTNTLAAGANSIVAEYGGDSTFAPSVSLVLNQVVNPASTTTVLKSSANPSSSGETVNLRATVTSSTAARPTGTVTFAAGATTLGTVALEGVTATLPIATLPVGATAVTATYNGASNFTGSAGELTQTVKP